ncbi:hypothetical protein CHH35_00415 [Escherichia coli O157:H7]|nr:hypothetical protein CHH35_00415 [Escherichia coli O157:H7]
MQDVLAGLEDRRVALIRQQAAEQNKVYQSMLVMTVSIRNSTVCWGWGMNCFSSVRDW